MKELEFIETIKNTLSKNSFIGDDCAYLKELNLVVTQDSLVEDIHFSLKTSTPNQLGYKAIIVNISDIFAAGGIPKYVTVSLSLPKNIDNNFVKEFYKACDELSKEFDFEIVGGDITGSNKIYISVCAFGLTNGRTISSRKNAKAGDSVITTGAHGSSAAGLWLIQHRLKKYPEIETCHLKPEIKQDFSNEIATKTTRDYAMMDTSDGLADALFKIAQSSNVSIAVDFDKIPYDKKIEGIARLADVDYRNWILYGGEDYKLVACIDKENLSKINSPYTIIGKVEEKTDQCPVKIMLDEKIIYLNNLEQTFDHFQ